MARRVSPRIARQLGQAHEAPLPPPPPVQYAGFWRRFLALIIDYFILQTIYLLLAVVSAPFIVSLEMGGVLDLFFSPDTLTGPNQVWLIIMFYLLVWMVVWLYYALMESSSRQATLGKIAIGMVVTDLEGNRIGFGRATGRQFAKLISYLILWVGFIMAGFTEKKQALHDSVAGTLVVMKPRY